MKRLTERPGAAESPGRDGACPGESTDPRYIKAEVWPGDFFHIPAGLVHRDVNASPSEVAVVVNVSVGTGPVVVNVSEP